MSQQYDDQFLNELQDINAIENRFMDLKNRLNNAAASHVSIQLTDQDFDLIQERSQAWQRLVDIARHPF